MKERKAATDPAANLDTVRALLRTASTLLDELEADDDPLAVRWGRVFERMPAEDRAHLVKIVEREVELRLRERSAPGDSPSGFTIVRPNPNARLYVRVFGQPTQYHSRDELMRAMLRAARMFLLIPAESIADWEAATLDAFRLLEPAEREAVAAHNRQMLALLERTAREPKKAS